MGHLMYGMKNEQEKAHMSMPLFFLLFLILSLYHIQSYMCSVEKINLSFTCLVLIYQMALSIELFV